MKGTDLKCLMDVIDASLTQKDELSVEVTEVLKERLWRIRARGCFTVDDVTADVAVDCLGFDGGFDERVCYDVFSLVGLDGMEEFLRFLNR